MPDLRLRAVQRLTRRDASILPARAAPWRLLPSAVVSVITAAAIAAASTAAAEMNGQINAVASATIPAGVPIAVTAKDESGRNGVLQAQIEAALQARGFVVDPQAAWQLQFATALDAMRNGRPIIRLMGRVGSNSRADMGVELPLPQWPGQGSGDTVYRYNVSMTLGERGRPAIWQGAATAVRPERDSIATDRALAGALLDRFGETIPDQPLALP